MNHVLYITPVRVPSSSAASQRILGVAKAFDLIGYKVSILCDGNHDPDNVDNIDISFSGQEVYSEFSGCRKFINYIDSGKRVQQVCEEKFRDVDLIILYSGYMPYVNSFIPFCKKHGIYLAFDAVEWYGDPRKLAFYFNPYLISIEYSMRVLLPKCRNLIVISTYLERYYKKRGCNTLIIPPISKSFNTFSKYNKLTFGFLGSPGKKDLILNYIEVFVSLWNDGYDFNFILAGVQMDELKQMSKLKGLSSYEGLSVLGRIDQNDAHRVVSKCHFVLLQRGYNRITKAGFPTKFVEAMNLGTPVICNLTSDLYMYVEDGKNAIVLENDTKEAFEQGVKKVFSLESKEIIDMSVSARNTYKSHFSPSLFKKDILKFINNLKHLK